MRSCRWPYCKGCGKFVNTELSSLTLGTLTLTPTFDSSVTEYATTTTNQGNKITAVAEDATAEIAITLNGDPAENESTLSWDEGENEVEIVVTWGSRSKTYSVTVTKTEASE